MLSPSPTYWKALWLRHARQVGLLLAPVLLLGATALAAPTPDGALLYQQYCALCHGAQGQGNPGVFPPLAQSDFLTMQREKTLRAPLEGLAEKITVNGATYHGAMPPVMLDDAQMVAVFQYIFSAWGNNVPPPTVEEIAQVRAKTRFPTLAALKSVMVGEQLPAAPEGWEVKIGAELNFSPSRITLHPDGEHLLLLNQTGDVWMWHPDKPEVWQILAAADYLDSALGGVLAAGLGTDRSGRVYITSNQRFEGKDPIANEVTIFRTAPWQKGLPLGKPMPWYRASYPFGIGPYNHGLSHIAQGPDGLLYVNSGARTDGGEAGANPRLSQAGEEPNTACMWRLNPEDEHPTVEIYARGLRNTYGFCWDDAGRMLGTENGPDADPPEELNLIEAGKHYGFPYQYADWERKPYPHTPDLPTGTQVTRPFANLGPAGGGNPAHPISTLDAHSCPSGIVWLGKDWPAPLGGSFLTARFGNLLKLPQDVGFDVLQMRPDYTQHTVAVHQLLAPLGRPIDLATLSGHRLVIAEYCRGTSLEAGIGTPGRLLILQPKRH